MTAPAVEPPAAAPPKRNYAALSRATPSFASAPASAACNGELVSTTAWGRPIDIELLDVDEQAPLLSGSADDSRATTVKHWKLCISASSVHMHSHDVEQIKIIPRHALTSLEVTNANVASGSSAPDWYRFKLLAVLILGGLLLVASAGSGAAVRFGWVLESWPSLAKNSVLILLVLLALVSLVLLAYAALEYFKPSGYRRLRARGSVVTLSTGGMTATAKFALRDESEWRRLQPFFDDPSGTANSATGGLLM